MFPIFYAKSWLLDIYAKTKSAWWTLRDNIAEIRGFIGWLGGKDE